MNIFLSLLLIASQDPEVKAGDLLQQKFSAARVEARKCEVLQDFAKLHRPKGGAHACVSTDGQFLSVLGADGPDGCSISVINVKAQVIAVAGAAATDGRDGEVMFMGCQGEVFGLPGNWQKNKNVKTQSSELDAPAKRLLSAVDELEKRIIGERNPVKQSAAVREFSAKNRPPSGVALIASSTGKLWVGIGADGTEKCPDGVSMTLYNAQSEVCVAIGGNAKKGGKRGDAVAVSDKALSIPVRGVTR